MQHQMKFLDTLGAIWFATLSVVFGCILLVLNGGVIAALYFSLADAGPGWMKNHSVTQFALFVGPVLLLIFQWSLIDLVGRNRIEDRRSQQSMTRRENGNCNPIDSPNDSSSSSSPPSNPFAVNSTSSTSRQTTQAGKP